MLRAGFHRTIKLSLLLGLAVCVGSINAAEPKPETVSQRLLKAKSANLDPELRVLAIDSLAGVSKEEESDNKVIEGLLDIVKSTNDIFVRIAAIDALGKLQINVTKDDKAKTKYLDPFLAILKSKDEHVKVRVAVANVFKLTLDKNKLADTDQVFKPAILPVASNKADPTLLRVVCIQAIGEFGKAENIAILADLLIEEDPQIRTATVDAILTLMSKAAEVQVPVPVVNKLLDVMRDEKADLVLRVAVMKLMAQLIRENNTTAKNEAFPYFV
jgi:HEAT repeat protein